MVMGKGRGSNISYGMGFRITVCFKCTDREVGCHSNCSKYLDEKRQHDESMVKINAIRDRGKYQGHGAY